VTIASLWFGYYDVPGAGWFETMGPEAFAFSLERSAALLSISSWF